MKPQDIVQDLHDLEAALRAYEKRFGMLTRDFYEAYMDGDEPLDNGSRQDEAAWAAAYQKWLAWQAVSEPQP